MALKSDDLTFATMKARLDNVISRLERIAGEMGGEPVLGPIGLRTKQIVEETGLLEDSANLVSVDDNAIIATDSYVGAGPEVGVLFAKTEFLDDTGNSVLVDDTDIEGGDLLEDLGEDEEEDLGDDLGEEEEEDSETQGESVLGFSMVLETIEEETEIEFKIASYIGLGPEALELLSTETEWLDDTSDSVLVDDSDLAPLSDLYLGLGPEALSVLFTETEWLEDTSDSVLVDDTDLAPLSDFYKGLGTEALAVLFAETEWLEDTSDSVLVDDTDLASLEDFSIDLGSEDEGVLFAETEWLDNSSGSVSVDDTELDSLSSGSDHWRDCFLIRLPWEI